MAIKRIFSAYLLFGIFSVAMGFAAGVCGFDLIHKNEKATEVIVTVFSILAGFLIAIMTLLGDASLLPGGWKLAESRRKAISAKLIRQKWLFYLYLMTLSVIFASSLLNAKYPIVSECLERIYFGLAVTAFFLSFRLPASLMAVQLDRVDAVIGARREKAGSLDQS